MNKLIRVLKRSKILLPVFIVSMFLGLFLFFYIPIVSQESMIQNIVKHSKESVERLQIQREYYVSSVVGDVKKYAPNLSFDYNHEGIDSKLPFPTTIVHNLSALYSQRGDVKFALYSEYPFLNRKDRVLTPFQKKAIKEVEKSQDGVYYEQDIIDGKEVIRVAVADYMVLPACVECHNTHKLKDWDFKWKLGDKRGVLEVITPIDSAVENILDARNKIVIASLGLMFFLVIYYAFILIRREDELFNENEILNEDLNDIFEDFDKNVIASKTDLKGKITYASKKFCEVSGYTHKELIGENHNIVRHPDVKKEIFEDMWKTIEEDKLYKGEIKNRKKNGEHYWVYAVISPLYNKERKKIGYSAVRQDITDKKKIIELNNTLKEDVNREVNKNRQKDQQLMQQSRLAQMGEMISMIAHQWRQPLAAIGATSAAINLKARLNKLDREIALEYSSEISEYSKHLSETIDDFRDFFKINKQLQKTTFKELIEGVLGIVRFSIIDNNIEIVTSFNDRNSFNTYPNEIKQVLLNLIINAQEALVERSIEKPQIILKTDNEKLSVIDNGGGIDEDIMEKIFDPYFSTKKKKDGTGLGLYMSKIIIEEHCGGKLDVSNTQDGVMFTIKLGAIDG